ncbi:uncharacterized protein BDV14DRAFT_206652 [Aspergillus stella-maris]|uniref:uncharacterized protein n=1 Tax=Aspergillus stella-maris TaxID=1810926 RepID=UPI003CCD9D7F
MILAGSHRIQPGAFAGTVAQFVTLAGAVSSRIHKYCKSASNVPVIYRELSTHIPVLAELCRRLEADPSVNPDQQLTKVLDGCVRNLNTLNQVLSKVVPERRDSIASRVVKALRSVGAEEKAKECKAELESYKATLNLYLTAQASLQPAAPQSVLTYYHLPSIGRSKFVGRKDILEALDCAVKAQGRDTRVAVLLGMGGQGKTSLAIEYCRREKARSHFRTILWINSASQQSIQRSFVEIAKTILALSSEQRTFPTSQAHITFVHTTIERQGGQWLIVFDNYDWPQRIKNILHYTPSSSAGALIMTTRHADVAPLGTLIPVTGMNEVDAVELLLERTGHTRTVAHLSQARAVVKLLGYLPLAVEQSAAYIRSRKISPEEFLDHYKHRKEKILRDVPSIWEYQRSMGGDEAKTEAPLGVFTTWEMSFVQAKEHSPIGDGLAHFLSALAFFGPLYIRMEMFQAYFEGLHKSGAPIPPWIRAFSDATKWSKFEYQDVVVFLADLSLIRYSGASGDSADDDDLEDVSGFCTLSLHPLVRDWIQLRLTADERRQRTSEALIILGHYIVSSGIDYQNWSLKVRLQALSHADATLELQSTYASNWAGSPIYDLIKSALQRICTFYMDNGRYDEAERICKEVLLVDRRIQPPRTDGASAEVQLTDIFLLQGRYKEAEESITALLGTSIIPSEYVFNQETKVRILKNLAKSIFKQGRYDEAVSIYQDVLRQQALFLPSDHLDVLNTRELLAQVYRNQGQHDQAITLYNMVLDSYRASGLATHLEALHCMVNLANTYRAQAQYDLAKQLYKDASREVSAKLHADHPTALSTKLFKAINLRELQRHDEAEEDFRDVIERSARVLGLLHPDTLKATMNYAILCDRSGKPVEAEEVYRQTLDGREKKLGVDNPYTLRTVERLVSLLWNQGRLDESLEITNRTLANQKRKPEVKLKVPEFEKDLETKTSNPKYRPAEILFEAAITRDMEALDEAHRDRIETQKSLAAVYAVQGRIKEAKYFAGLAEAGEDVLYQRLGVALRHQHRLDSGSTLVPTATMSTEPVSYEEAINDPSPSYSENSD